MKQEITTNLLDTLQGPIDKVHVVYIIVELRKLIDRLIAEKGMSFPHWDNVRYWCDWSLHTVLERKFAKSTLNAMEKFIIENPGEKFHWSEFNSSFISLESLRWSLYKFLNENNLPSKIINIPPWDSFTKYLIENLRECPLVKKDGLIRGFKFIKKGHIPEAEKYSIDYEVIFDDPNKNIVGSVLRFEKQIKKASKNKSGVRCDLIL